MSQVFLYDGQTIATLYNRIYLGDYQGQQPPPVPYISRVYIHMLSSLKDRQGVSRRCGAIMVIVGWSLFSLFSGIRAIIIGRNYRDYES